jgi:hypothetical protein
MKMIGMKVGETGMGGRERGEENVRNREEREKICR